MELRTLRYFLGVAREENMTRAAQTLHVTQPTLSKQLKALEDELGAKLFTRHSFSIELTEEGALLRRRAEDLVRMADKIAGEFMTLGDVTGGDIYFGLAESFQIRYLARELRAFKRLCPGLRYHITSGDTEQVTKRLNKGILDFGVLAEEPDASRYAFLPFPEADVWGAVVRADSPLAQRATVRPEDLAGVPLFCSEQSWARDIPRWCGERMGALRLEGSFRLAYNGAVFAQEGLGVLLTFARLVDTSPGSGLVFVPLEPRLETRIWLVWKRYQVFTPVAQRFLEQVRASFAGEAQT